MIPKRQMRRHYRQRALDQMTQVVAGWWYYSHRRPETHNRDQYLRYMYRYIRRHIDTPRACSCFSCRGHLRWDKAISVKREMERTYDELSEYNCSD